MYKIQVSGKAMAVLPIVVLIAALTTARPEKKHEDIIQGGPIGSLPEAIPEISILYNSTLDASVLAAGCGGTINLPAFGTVYTMDYKYGIAYANNERCVWLVNNTIGSYRAALKVAWTLTLNGFESGYDFLKVLHWNRTTGMSSRTLAANTRTEMSAEAMFLSFSSDESNVGTGFLVRIEFVLAETSPNYTATNYVYTSTAYSRPRYAITHGPYKNNEVTTALILRKSDVTASFLYSVDYLYSENSTSCEYDRLDVFEVIRTGVQLRSRLCGNYQSSPLSFRTTDPVIALFGSDYSNVGEGFKLAWSD